MLTRALLGVALIVGLIGLPLTAAAGSGDLRTGVFAGPVIGLKYETPTVFGVTNEKGEFQYRPGEAVTFSVGEVVLGTVRGADRVHEAQLVSRVDGRIDKVKDPILTNLARFLETLDQDGNVENGVTITSQVHTIVGNRSINFGQSEEEFSRDSAMLALLADLNRSAVFTAQKPRELLSPAAARNAVRRNIRGIIKTSDVKIPLRDGSFVYADVFRPAQEGKYPPVMAMSIYGKAFQHECICNERQAEDKEELEDRYFSGNPDGFQYEDHETVNTVDWVPKGYVVIRIDTRGACKSPGTLDPLSLQEAKDYYDAIEWAAKQPWSNGNVGLWGMSYTAMDQYNVASLQPPHLKAIISNGTDTSSYEAVLYNGGIFNEQQWSWWWNAYTAPSVCGERNGKDFLSIAKAHQFNDPSIYGPNGTSWISPDMGKVTVPQWIVMPATQTHHIHQLGSSQTYIRATAAKDKKLSIVEDWFANSYGSLSDHMAFFDYWLKGIQNGIMDQPPVRVWIRTGKGGYYLQDENEWPIARTKYARWYLDASPSKWTGDARRRDVLRISQTVPSAEKRTSYSAEVDAGTIYPGKPGSTPCWATGMSFVSDPMQEDMVLAGYMKLGLWVSSTSSDMDIYASVRVIDDGNHEVNYTGPTASEDSLKTPSSGVTPLGIGWLKVSHRKLDPKNSTEYWPDHTDAEADYAPLKGNEVVPVEVGILPTTGVVKKGFRIRVDIQPYEGCGHGRRHTYYASYHTGAENSIYTGPNHPSYLQLPVIPSREAQTSAAGARP